MITLENVMEKMIGKHEEVVEMRRYLHRFPELSFHEHATSQYVFDTLTAMGGLEVTRPTKTSVKAVLKGAFPGKTVALRADLDALPIQEETGLPFASEREGVMHACAHDGHTAMLLGAAGVLKEFREQIKGTLVFLFQHAEELPPGGAKDMVEAGVMENVDEVTGIHLMANIPYGTISTRTGPLTSASDMFTITVQGKGGHASMPDMTVDPVAIGAQIVSSMNQIVSRNVDPLQSAVISVTRFRGGGEALNVIPDMVEIGGSVRVFNDEIRELIRLKLSTISQGIAQGHGAEAFLDYRYGYNPVVNDEAVTKRLMTMIGDHFPDKRLEDMDPMLGGEDFSAFSKEKPGCYIMIGAGNEGKGITYPHHHPKFDIDEEALKDGLHVHVLSALTLTESIE